jgi:TatD DNase family protein
MLIDTHSHIYLSEFDDDRQETVDRAKVAGVGHIILPNVDKETLNPMLALEATDTNYFRVAIGLHPTSVNEGFRDELAWVKKELERRPYCAVGEIGIDLYWDKTFREQQIEAFEQQLQWAVEYDLPVIIHQREAFEVTFQCIKKWNCNGLRGVFHSFSSSLEVAKLILSLGDFYLGINGVVTFKNTKLPQVLAQLSPENLVLETDAPYLTPVPYRGQRNESAYVSLVAQKVAEIYHLPVNAITEATEKNAVRLFKLI